MSFNCWSLNWAVEKAGMISLPFLTVRVITAGERPFKAGPTPACPLGWHELQVLAKTALPASADPTPAVAPDADAAEPEPAAEDVGAAGVAASVAAAPDDAGEGEGGWAVAS